MKMCGGVLVGAGIATANPATLQAHAQMSPHLLAQCRTVLAVTRRSGQRVMAGVSRKLRAEAATRRLGYPGSTPK